MIDPGGAGQTVLSQTENSNVSPELQEFVGRPAGHGRALFRAILNIAGKATFTSSQIGTLLALAPSGAVCDAPCDVYYKLANCQGSDRTAETHKKLTFQSAIFYWEQMELPNVGKESNTASMNCVFQPIFDGTNAMFTVSEGVAIAESLTYDEAFGCGPVWVQNDTAGGDALLGKVDGIQKVTVNNSPSVQLHYAGSEVNPSAVTIDEWDVMLEIETTEFVNFTRIPDDGLCLDGVTGLVTYARRLEPCKTRYANTEPEHIKIAAAEGLVMPGTINGQGRAPTTHNFKVGTIAPDDTSLEVIYTVGQAIVAPA